MRYETLRGPSMAKLMSQMREKHGSAAVIIKQQQASEGGFLGTKLLSTKIYELHYMIPERAAAETSAVPAGSRERKKVKPAEFERVSRQELVEQLKKRMNPLPEAQAVPVNPNPPLPAAPAAAVPAAVSVSTPVVRPPAGMEDSSIERIRDRLTTAQFSTRMVDRIVHDLENHLSRNERSSTSRVQEKALERLASVIRTVPDIAPARGEIRAVMLIGPTGMGKTTSIAKLAARYFFYEKREVSLYSLDRYRLAATQQLRMYADVMKIPFFSPLNPAEFRELTARDPGELLLIDTSGIGYRDSKRLEELAALAEACAVRLEKHLVIAANTERATLEPILEAYDRVGFDKILLTKLDESEFIGSFIELADKVNRPFSFLTNGQDVPADLIGPGPEDMAKMVLGKDSRG